MTEQLIWPKPNHKRRILQGSAGYVVNEIVLHCSATRPEWLRQPNATEKQMLEAQFAEIKRWHMVDRGWKDIGYHWIIGRSGLILPGRPENVIGAGVEGHNRGVIHVCLIGGHGSERYMGWAESFEREQIETLKRQIVAIASRTPISLVSGHNQYAAKACPGFDVPFFVSEQGGPKKLLGY